MRVLVTGNMGYVGPVLVRHLKTMIPEISVIGFDAGFFAHCLTGSAYVPEILLDAQHFGDVRDFPLRLLEGIDAVVHLAAISNDPMGSRFEQVTDAVNFRASAELARLAADQGVKRFVFASSCSMYGSAEGGPRRESDPLNPLTAYARSKAATEGALGRLANSGMTITALRFATACGESDRIRLDLVLNDFVACALATKEITVLSDGTPWRPLIDVKDMSRAIEWAIQREPELGGPFLAVNVGCDEWNFQVQNIAESVARAIPGVRVHVNRDAPPDKRSYRVDFSTFQSLAPRFQPQMELSASIEGIRRRLESVGFADRDFRASHFMRLKVLESHIAAGRLTQDLCWS